MINLKEKNIIVTGASGGIGNSIVEHLYMAGANVLATGTKIEKLEQLKKKFSKIKTLPFDISKHDKIESFINDANELLGGNLNCLVNNAGVAGPTLSIEEIDAEDWSHCLNVCLSSQFYFVKSCLKQLRKSSSASIVNISSAAGQYGFALRTPYASAKWGVIGLTKSLSIELGKDKIRVNAILPGLVAGDRQQNVLRTKAQMLGKPFNDVEEEAFSFTSIRPFTRSTDPVLVSAPPVVNVNLEYSSTTPTVPSTLV